MIDDKKDHTVYKLYTIKHNVVILNYSMATDINT